MSCGEVPQQTRVINKNRHFGAGSLVMHHHVGANITNISNVPHRVGHDEAVRFYRKLSQETLSEIAFSAFRIVISSGSCGHYQALLTIPPTLIFVGTHCREDYVDRIRCGGKRRLPQGDTSRWYVTLLIEGLILLIPKVSIAATLSSMRPILLDRCSRGLELRFPDVREAQRPRD